MELAHAGEEVLAGLLVDLDAETGILLGDLPHRLDELRQIPHMFRLDRHGDDRLRDVPDLFERDHRRVVGHRRAGERIGQSDDRGDIAGGDLFDHQPFGTHEQGDVLDPVLELRPHDVELHAFLQASREDPAGLISPALGSIVMSVTMNPVGPELSVDIIATPTGEAMSPFQMFGMRYRCAVSGEGRCFTTISNTTSLILAFCAISSSGRWKRSR